MCQHCYCFVTSNFNNKCSYCGLYLVFQQDWIAFFSCYASPLPNKTATAIHQIKECCSGCLEATESPKPSKYGKLFVMGFAVFWVWCCCQLYSNPFKKTQNLLELWQAQCCNVLNGLISSYTYNCRSNCSNMRCTSKMHVGLIQYIDSTCTALWLKT